jgi:hypothetical protein
MAAVLRKHTFNNMAPENAHCSLPFLLDNLHIDSALIFVLKTRYLALSRLEQAIGFNNVRAIHTVIGDESLSRSNKTEY